MSTQNAAQMLSQFDQTHTQSRKAERKTKKAVIEPHTHSNNRQTRSS
jgi:hypothetical protein